MTADERNAALWLVHQWHSLHPSWDPEFVLNRAMNWIIDCPSVYDKDIALWSKQWLVRANEKNLPRYYIWNDKARLFNIQQGQG